MLNKSTLNEWLHYDPETGLLTWKKRAGPRCKMGEPIGTLTKKGYLRFRFQRVNIMVHSAIWIMTNGEKLGQIDHINGIKTDNRLVNLRVVDNETNARNRSKYRGTHQGPTGVYETRGGRFEAVLCDKYLGRFDTVEEALEAREAAKRGNGFTDRHGE